MANLKFYQKWLKSICMATMVVAISTMAAHAQLLIYDGFDYPVGSIDNSSQNGGIGFNSGSGSSAWDIQNTGKPYSIQNSAPLTYLNLSVTGNYVSGGNDFTGFGRRIRDIWDGRFGSLTGMAPGPFGSYHALGAPGETSYVSFLMRINTTFTWDNVYLQLSNGNGWTQGDATSILGIGYYGSTNSETAGTRYWTLRAANSYQQSNVPIVNGDVVFVVLKMQHGSPATYSLFINPTSLASEPGSPNAQISGTGFEHLLFQNVNFYAQNPGHAQLDEFRWGRTWADVTPTVSLISIAGINITATSNIINTAAGTTTVTSTFTPSNATAPVVTTWQSSNPVIASVASNGVVTSNRNGIVTITGKVGNLINTLTGFTVITVTNQPIPPAMAYDGLGSTAVSLSGINTGFGWSGGWVLQNSDNANYVITDDTPLSVQGLLSETPFYGTAGNGFQNLGRALNNSFSGPFAAYFDPVDEFDGNRKIGAKPGTVMFISALLRKNDDNDNEAQFLLHNQGGIPWFLQNENQSFGVGYFGAANSNDAGVRYWTLKVGTNYVRTNVPVVAGEAAFAVLKVEFGASPKVSLFMNPASTTFAKDDEPAIPSATYTHNQDISFRSVWIYHQNTNGINFDEIRFGATWATVTPAQLATSVSVSAPNITAINGTATATATVLPANAADKTVTWSANPTAVATISGAGVIQALDNGVVTITAVSNSVPTLTGIAVVTITGQAPTSVSISSVNGLTTDGFNLTFTSTVTPTVANNEIEWSVNNASIATISNQGILSPVAAGTITVTGAAKFKPSVFATAVVTIPQINVNEILLSAANISTFQGTSTVTATALPASATNTNVDLTLQTGGLQGITLVNKVLATDGSSNGVVTITAVAQANPSLVRTITVTISGQNPSSITLNTTSGVISTYRGTLLFTASVAPALANQNFTWSVTNTSVATISGAGVLRALSNGVVTVRAQAQNGTIAGTASITVTGQSVESIALTASVNPIVTKGGASVISATVSPAGVPDGLTYTVSNTSIATISGLGILRALSDGIVTVTATSVETPSVSQNIVITVTGQADPIVVPTGLTISIPGEIMAGMSESITFVVQPDGITVAGVTFTSSDPAVLSISGTTAVALTSGTVTITGSIDNTTITASAVVNVTASVPGSVFGGKSAVKLYPNPTTGGAFNIEAATSGMVSVKNMLGAEVAAFVLKAGSNTYQLSGKGVYVVVITLSSGETSLSKLVVE